MSLLLKEEFSDTQLKMLDILRDGFPHTWQELQKCLPDELSGKVAVQQHIYKIRKVLAPRGQDIVCQYLFQKYMYRWVILLSKLDD